ncbi:hypothetical protein JMUB7555_27280 [Staphylococcus aureus]
MSKLQYSLRTVAITAMVLSYPLAYLCLLYTSDAADEGLGVDLGGRRIIKKSLWSPYH